MKTFFRSLLAATLFAGTTFSASAQAPATAPDTARIVLNSALINAVNTQSFEQFRETVRPLIAQMPAKK